MTMLTDDDLGARLRAALQEVSPLAGDPVPAPQFLSDGAAGVGQKVSAEVVELDAAAPSPRRSRRRIALAVGVLAAAAAVAGVLVVTSHPPKRAAGVDPAASTSASPSSTPSPYDGVTPSLVPWRCTAPAGSQITGSASRPYPWLIRWVPGPDTTCTPRPDDVSWAVDDGPAPFDVTIANGSARCRVYLSQVPPGDDYSVVSRGEDIDFVEFYGEDCRMVLPER